MLHYGYDIDPSKYTAVDHVKSFVLDRMIMRRRTVTRWVYVCPCSQFAAGAFTVEMNDDFLSKRVQHAPFFWPNYRR